MQKVYERIVWVDFPSTKTALASRLLNRMDYAIDEIDNRVVELSSYEENVAEMQKQVQQSEANAKSSEMNAKRYEKNAKEYSQNAFAGTPEGYEDLVDRVNSPVIRQTTEETIFGCEGGGLKLLKVGGNSYQRTSGNKNKLNLNGVFDGLPDDVTEMILTGMGVKVTYVADEERRVSHIVVEGTNGGNITLKNNFTTEDVLILNGCIGGSKDTYYLFFRDADGVYYYDYGNGVSIPKGKTGAVGVYASAGTETTMHPMLSKNGGAYEPYGYPVSPSPENKSDIASVGDCVEMEQGWYNDSGVKATARDCIRSVRLMPCKVGDKIAVSNDFMTSYSIVYFNNDEYVSRVNYGASGTSRIVPSGVNSFGIYLYKAGGITLETVGKITLTVNGKYAIVIRTHGKNLLSYPYATNNFTANGITVTMLEKGRIHFKGTSTYTTNVTLNYVNVKKGTTYSFSESVLSKIGIQVWEWKNGTYGKELQYTQPRAFDYTFEEDMTICVRVAVLAGVTVDDTIYPMMRESDTDDTYEPYKETQAIAWVDSPLMQGDELCKKDGKWYIKRVRKALTLNGTENITWGIRSDNAKHVYAAPNNLWSDHDSTITPDVNLLCNRFKGGKYSEDGYIWFSSNYLNFKGDVEFATSAEVNTWLTTHLLEVEYELAKPIFEELSVDSQIALNALETYAGVTYIIIDSHIKTSGILSEYGTTKIAAYTLKSLLNSESNKVLIEELSTAIIAVGSEE